jgi:hypothetical protein
VFDAAYPRASDGPMIRGRWEQHCSEFRGSVIVLWEADFSIVVAIACAEKLKFEGRKDSTVDDPPSTYYYTSSLSTAIEVMLLKNPHPRLFPYLQTLPPRRQRHPWVTQLH